MAWLFSRMIWRTYLKINFYISLAKFERILNIIMDEWKW